VAGGALYADFLQRRNLRGWRRAKVFTDRDFVIESLAPELKGLTGIRFSHEMAKKGR
jgi:hypothetical protein